MATTTIYTYTGDGIVNLWTVAFTYLKKSHVKLYIDDVEDTTFTWVTDSSIAATTTPGDGAEVKVQRVTPRSALDTVLPNSGTFRGSDINNQSLQALYVAEEGYDALVNVLQLDPTVNEWDFQSYQSKNIPTPTSDDSAANKAYVDAVAGSATAAAASATAAASSASAAATSATNAASSATSASTSASTATTQASAASTSATAAAASATAAAASETAAAASQSAAASSASTASTAATTATTQATNASNSATAAQAAQTAAELALDTFDDIFLGSKASAPTLDNDGDALQQGALYWNSTTDDLWIYNSGAWEVAAVPATSGVTKVGTPVDNQIGVWTGDGTMEGDVNLTWSGSELTVKNTTDTATAGALRIEGDRATPTSSDQIYASFFLSNAVGTQKEFGRISVQGWDLTNAAEDGSMIFRLVSAGTILTAATLSIDSFRPGAISSSLGLSSVPWADLFLESGGVINWNASDVLLTHSANALALTGGTFGIGKTPSAATLDIDTGGGTTWAIKTEHTGSNFIVRPKTSSGSITIIENTGGGGLEICPSGGNVTANGNLVKQVGQETIWVPANAMTPTTTNGAASSTEELATNDVMLAYLAFDATTQENACFQIQMPKSWDEGTIIAQFVWKHPSTATNFGIVFGIQAVAFANDDALDTAFGTAVEIADTGGTTNDAYITSETSAMTVAGTPGAEEFVVFKVYRKPADASDTMAVDAQLLGVKLHYTTDAANDS